MKVFLRFNECNIVKCQGKFHLCLPVPLHFQHLLLIHSPSLQLTIDSVTVNGNVYNYSFVYISDLEKYKCYMVYR